MSNYFTRHRSITIGFIALLIVLWAAVENMQVIDTVYAADEYDIQLASWVYQGQGVAGERHSSSNCGPASVVMAVRAVKNAFWDLTPEEVRNTASVEERENGFTNGSDIEKMLNEYQVDYRKLSTYAELESAILEKHHLVIAWMNMAYLPPMSSDYKEVSQSGCHQDIPHCIQQTFVNTLNHQNPELVTTHAIWNQERPLFGEGRYYPYADGHWMLLKGKVRHFLPMYIAFDPLYFNNPMYRYLDNTPKGEGRNYSEWYMRMALTDSVEPTENSGVLAYEILDPVIAGNWPQNGPSLRAVNVDAQQVEIVSEEEANLRFSSHSNYPPVSVFSPGQVVTKAWSVINVGDLAIGNEYGIFQTSGTAVSVLGKVKFSQTIPIGAQAVIFIKLQVPATPGKYSTSWQVVDPFGNPIGDLLPFSFIVDGSQPIQETAATPASNCGNEQEEGVYFYSDPQFSGDCYFTRSYVGNFTDTYIGDDRLSSVMIIGNWKVKLFEDVNFSGDSVEITQSDDDLDIRSLGDQFTSAKVDSTASSCPGDNREGVYLYSDTQHEGRCLYSTTDIKDLGGTIMGNDTLSSIQFIGNWEAQLFEDVNFGGDYDVLGSDDPDLDIRSLGDQYSSIKIEKINVLPTSTPTSTPTAAPISFELLGPHTNNGGFESGMSGWSVGNYSFDLANDLPHTGNWFIRGTSSTEAWFYRDFNMNEYNNFRNWIDQKIASSFFSVWVNPGKSEEFRFIVRFRNSNGTDLYTFDTGWSYFAGEDWLEKSGNVEKVPPGTSLIRVEMHMRRSNGDYTDMDTDDISLKIQFGPTPGPTPTPTPIPSPMKGNSVSINNDEQYTNSTSVSLSLDSQGAVEMNVNSDSRLSENWIPFYTGYTWRFSSDIHYSSQAVFVYAWFKNEQNQIMGPYQDEIIYDPVPPTGWISTVGTDGGTKNLLLIAVDENGVMDMRMGASIELSSYPWMPFQKQVSRQASEKITYVQFRDSAGNLSDIYGSNGSIVRISHFAFLPYIRR